jgi:hypothetical protein
MKRGKTRRTGGAYTIRKEGDKWYIYRGEKRSSTPHNSFKEASESLKQAIGVVALKNMKGKGTRRHRKY